MDFQSINKIIVIIINLIGFWLLLWVYFSGKEKIFRQGFVLLVIPNLLWIDFYNLAFTVNNSVLSLLLVRLTFASAIIFLVVFYNFFILWFLKEKGRYVLLGKVIVFSGIIFSLFCIFTNFIIESFEIKTLGIVPIFSEIGILVFHLFALFITIFVISRLIFNYFKFSKSERLKIQYFLTGVIIFSSGVLFLGVILPFFIRIYDYYNFANYFTILFLAFTAYAIVKQNLFGIKIVLTALLVSFIAILIALDIFIFTESRILQIFKAGGLIMFLYLGRSLIRGVLEEEKMLKKMEKLNEDLAEANDSLKELIEMKTSFLHIVSHQLRTPLTAMRGYISMWKEGDFDGYTPRKMAEVKTRIANNTERLNNLVNDMVVAMESEGGIKLNFEKVDIEEIIKNNIEFLKANYEAKKLYLRYRKTEKNLPKIEADAKYLGNAFMNLIDNAEKYTQKGGLKITISKKDDSIKIIFADTGIGINSQDRKNLFHKFCRGAGSSLINPNGSGLGLYIIKQIIRDHHGKIEFESAGEGKGAIFTVTLPIRQPVSISKGGEDVKAKAEEEKAK